MPRAWVFLLSASMRGEHRDGERGGFTGAGLGLTSDVLALEGLRAGWPPESGCNGRVYVSTLQQRIVQAERSKRDGSEMIFA